MSKKKRGENSGENGFEDWGGYMAAKQAKLEEQFRNEAHKEFQDATKIFEGIAIFVNGYTDPNADELRRLMMSHGGIYHHYMRPRATTHIIASNLPYSKIMLYRKSQNPIPICKPQWIVDSIQAGRILNFQKYLLYSNCTDVQPQLKYKIKDKGNEANMDFHNERDENDGGNIFACPNDNENEIGKNTTTNKDTSNLSVPLSSRDAQSTKNSDFISEFYSHSRLHHISTMGATFKDYVNELRDKSNGKFPGLARLKEFRDTKLSTSLSDSQLSFHNETLDFQDNKAEDNLGTIIMHIDMDCFFVSVGLRDKPELKGVPIAVTHAKGNKQPSSSGKEVLGSTVNGEEEIGSMSEVASCSYEARKAGVKNGMFLGEALKICPNLKTIPYDFEGYKEVSYTLYDTVASYTLDIEAVSCDEMYANCTKILQESCLTPMEFASIIRQEIRDKTGCPVSTGFGGNKLLARLATRKAKPDGQFYIKEEQIQACIGTFNVQDLPGVGATTTYKLNNMNVRTCAELQVISLTTLQKDFGRKTGEMLHNMCRGVDNSKLNLEHVRKSVSAEVNYGIRFESNEDAIDFLKKLSGEVSNRLKKANAKGRLITLKLLFRANEAPKDPAKFMGHGLCDYITKSKNVIAPINDVDIITKEVLALWSQMQRVPEDARGIGIQVSRLEILKNKSRNGSLTSFVNKMQSSASHKSTKSNQGSDPRPLPNSDPVASVSEPAVLDNRQDLYVSSNINESILRELPEDIRNEILDVRENRNPVAVGISRDQVSTIVLKTNETKTEKNVQTRHDTFFKKTKASVPKSTKVEMPPLQEIDMSVLVELPEDVRNEILNEYKANRNQPNVNSIENVTATSSTSNAVPANVNRDEQNISFSQVDPDFLAALPDDLRRDVQMYCTAKKVENSAKSKKDEAARNSGSTKAQTVTKQSKKTEHNTKTKNNGKNSKAVSSKSKKKKGIQAAFKNVEMKTVSEGTSDKKSVNVISKSVISTESIESVNDRVTVNEAELILSHNRTISGDNENAYQHQGMLIDLVNRLLNLPLEQVKMQIQIWITNSKIVNEVDFLSLATFLSMLPEKRRIEDLHVLLKTMHRCMTKTRNCIWHKTYRKTVKYVQHYMQIEYNSNLMVPPIKCNLLQCNNDVM